MLTDFISLLFPITCASCGKSLFKNEENICTYCIYHLPKTNFHLQEDNMVSKFFWGRVAIHSAAAFLEFNKGGNVQKLIYALKYNGQKNMGITLGKLYGHELKEQATFNTIDTIVPVPLHAKKEKVRGYNQSLYFAMGLAQSMNVPINNNSLQRVLISDTQTKKSRFNRWKNVESVFEIKEPNGLKGQHILLVDDVVTTGATLEACAHTLLQIPFVKISIVTIAFRP
ncbi:MAG: phosphoribosyltransferase family protein [Bacteroidia bacterium]